MPSSNPVKFDFIIVGGGTAGCVLASRISKAFPSYSIALIEAGGKDDHPAINPGFSLVPGWRGDIDWKYKSIPQAAAGGRQMDQAGGKCLGGSSAINFETWTRGPSLDYDQWAKTVNDESYSWKNMIPWFKRTETFHPSDKHGNQDLTLHGTDGPIQVTHVSNSGRPRNYPLRSLAEDILRRSGCHLVSDGNAGDVIGYFELASSTFNGAREWSSKRYVFGPNVQVFTNSLATKLDVRDNKVYGVIVRDHNLEVQTILATKEVICSAGCHGSSKLLLASGIGSSSDLEEVGIRAIADVPVGRNFSDHIAYQTFWRLDRKGVSFGDMPLETPEVDWLAGCPCDWLAYYSLDQLSPALRQLAQNSMTPAEFEVYSQSAIAEVFIMYGHIDAANIGVANPGGSVFTIHMQLLKPLSRGTIRLKSSNADEDVQIDPNILDHPLDREVLISLGQLITDILIGDFGEENGIHEYGIPQSIHGRTDRDSMEVRMRRTVDSYHHPSGSCSMGSVVNSRCQVHGISGLRVVDASIIPYPLAAHYQAIVYAVAEKIATTIEEEYMHIEKI